MNVSPLDLLWPALAGAAAGGVYVAALWFSVRRLAASRQGLPWLFIGSILRIAAVCAVFFQFLDGGLPELAAAVAGFTVVRLIAVQLVRRPAVPQHSS